jgi:hypothetical protein
MHVTQTQTAILHDDGAGDIGPWILIAAAVVALGGGLYFVAELIEAIAWLIGLAVVVAAAATVAIVLGTYRIDRREIAQLRAEQEAARPVPVVTTPTARPTSREAIEASRHLRVVDARHVERRGR